MNRDLTYLLDLEKTCRTIVELLYYSMLVVHCDRGANIRIISAKCATPSEKRSYEQGH
jgi:uncharacterized DUF497 family protein